jgi:hypothetical protein
MSFGIGADEANEIDVILVHLIISFRFPDLPGHPKE